MAKKQPLTHQEIQEVAAVALKLLERYSDRDLDDVIGTLEPFMIEMNRDEHVTRSTHDDEDGWATERLSVSGKTGQILNVEREFSRLEFDKNDKPHVVNRWTNWTPCRAGRAKAVAYWSDELREFMRLAPVRRSRTATKGR
ncbi:MAG: hypothetical protein NW203_04875 [Hyphomonadaceae bacterium]|nr:hypothetical protein [Hyphomonadaceae bacterium]